MSKEVKETVQVTLLQQFEGLEFQNANTKKLVDIILELEDDFVKGKKLRIMRSMLAWTAQLYPEDVHPISQILTKGRSSQQAVVRGKAKFVDAQVVKGDQVTNGCTDCGKDAKPAEMGPQIKDIETAEDVEAFFSFKKNERDALLAAKSFAKANGINVAGNIGYEKLCKRVLTYLKEEAKTIILK